MGENNEDPAGAPSPAPARGGDEDEQSPFPAHIDSYISHIDAIAETAPLALLMTAAARQAAGEQHDKFLDDHGKTDDGTTYICAGRLLRIWRS